MQHGVAWPWGCCVHYGLETVLGLSPIGIDISVFQISKHNTFWGVIMNPLNLLTADSNFHLLPTPHPSIIGTICLTHFNGDVCLNSLYEANCCFWQTDGLWCLLCQCNMPLSHSPVNNPMSVSPEASVSQSHCITWGLLSEDFQQTLTFDHSEAQKRSFRDRVRLIRTLSRAGKEWEVFLMFG